MSPNLGIVLKLCLIVCTFTLVKSKVSCPNNCVDCICGVLSNNGQKMCGTAWKKGDGSCSPGCQLNGRTCGCGPFSISKRYFRKCRKLTSLTSNEYRKCVEDLNCARKCVCAFVAKNVRKCTKKPRCTDYAYAHAIGIRNGRQLCKLKKIKPFTKSVIKCMQSEFTKDENNEQCIPIPLDPYSTDNPGTTWGTTQQEEKIAPPYRFNFKPPYPTHHFAVNQAKTLIVPIRLFPFSVVLSTDGATYDAYTLNRWSDPKRQMTDPGQTPNLNTWEKFPDTGINMEQSVTGPDGNPFGEFTGRSGIQVGASGTFSEPLWESYGALFANWAMTEIGGPGKIQIPLVRGSALATHIFENADPAIKPFCLSSVNGQKVAKYNCPLEPKIRQPGKGFLNGTTCTGGILRIRLRMTVPSSMKNIQYAYQQKDNWKAVMYNCNDTICKFSKDGKEVNITLSGASGVMFYAINNNGFYTIPADWRTNPIEITCTGKKKKRSKNYSNAQIGNVYINEISDNDRMKRGAETCVNTVTLPECGAPYCKYTFLKKTGSTYQLKIVIVLRQPYSKGLGNITVAFAPLVQFPVPLQKCTPEMCSISGTVFTYCVNNIQQEGPYGYALQFIGGIEVIPNDPTKPFLIQIGGTSQPLGTTDKFNLELDEPGNDLPQQTRKYVIYFSQPVQAFYNNGDGLTFKLKSGKKYSGTVKVGYLGSGPRNDKSMNNFLDPYKDAYSLNPNVTYCIDADKGTVQFNWNKRGSGPLLMTVLPHQNDMLSPLKNTPFGYKGYVGDKWSLVYDLPAATMMPDPDVINKLSPSQLKVLIQQLDKDTDVAKELMNNCKSNTYGAGLFIAMAARAASISRSLNTTHYQQIDPSIKGCAELWLRINDTLPEKQQLKYDTVWGGILNNNSQNNGFDVYNDHHFHFGYFLYSFGYYATFYSDWAKDHIKQILYLVRDVGNPSPEDPFYNPVRHKDIYMGQSWASGVGLTNSFRDQESSSEAINCYHGIAALGNALADVNDKYSSMRDLGRIWLAMEIKSVKQYYHVRDSNFDQFPPLIQRFGSIGMISEHSIYKHVIFFGCSNPDIYPAKHACITGIQVIPITKASRHSMDSEWAKHVNNSCQWAINPKIAPNADKIDKELLVTPQWGYGVFCLTAASAASPAVNQQAIDFLLTKQPPGEALIGGTGFASTLLFLYGRT